MLTARVALALLCILFASSLLADRIKTVDDVTFEGIVTEFSKDKYLKMQTGYGALRFDIKQVKSAAKAEYKWPKDADFSKPDRHADFEAWAKQFKDVVADTPKDPKDPKSPPKSSARQAVPDKKETDELDAATFSKRIADARAAKADQTLSAKERTDKFKSYGKFSAFVCARIASTNVLGNGDIEVQLDYDRNWYDARSGKKADLTSSSNVTLRAKKDVSGDDVDKLNENLAAAEKKNGWRGDEPSYYIEFSFAENARAGNGVVFKYTCDFSSGNEVWTFSITRLAPKKDPIVE